MSEKIKEDLTAQGEAEWNKLLDTSIADGSFINELPPADFMGRNFSNYSGRLMLLPDVDMGDFEVDDKGNRYFHSSQPSYKGYVCEFFPEILDKLRKFNSILGPGTGGKVQLIGRVKEVFTWWFSYIFIETVALKIPGHCVAFFENGSARLIGEDLLEARLVELKAESDADIPSGLTEVPSGLPPETIAKLFYHLCTVENNRVVWEKILSRKECWHGTSPLPRVSSWWDTMKKGNRTFYYVRTAEDEPDRKKYFFQMQIDGVDTSSPKPINVIKEDGEWRVEGGSV